MIYNLKNYLKAEVPSLSYAVNGANETSPKDLIIINETSSTPSAQIERTDYTVQIFSRAEGSLTAKKQILEVFEKVNRYYDVMLPEAVEELKDGTTITFPSIKAYQMIPLQRPSWFGIDPNGLPTYLFNLRVTTKE